MKFGVYMLGESAAAGGKQPQQPHGREGTLAASPALQMVPMVQGGFKLYIFDWDDTLFPTSFFSNAGPSPAPLQSGEAALAVIRRAHEDGRVMIISNGSPGWLTTCLAQSGYEKVRTFLTANQIPVVSARRHADLCGRADPRLSYTGGCFADALKVVEDGASTFVGGGVVRKVKMLPTPTEQLLTLQREGIVRQWDKMIGQTHSENLVLDTRFSRRRQAAIAELYADIRRTTDTYLRKDPGHNKGRPIACPPTINPANLLRRVSLWPSPLLAPAPPSTPQAVPPPSPPDTPLPTPLRLAPPKPKRPQITVVSEEAGTEEAATQQPAAKRARKAVSHLQRTSFLEANKPGRLFGWKG
ncbi:unnamed protein product [Vitrella brassicaformis CCMP3155]|uniref:Uncharacterized protein n=1 Tax=Vitrella brassicaformis (strain CCMP3155) TaxID=1169540 RepID=A0A0G4FAH6_VITBC|nr:unnamed protein product [Vitrella brassicaformis CCMP3155]|eukprot:CEM09901.1 unnamed protein product [Vitrella brassicaformis CCMP3155]